MCRPSLDIKSNMQATRSKKYQIRVVIQVPERGEVGLNFLYVMILLNLEKI